MMDFENENQFLTLIAVTLQKHPDWLPSAIDGVTRGMSEALAISNMKRANAMAAMACALSLATPDRLSAEAKEVLNAKIVQVIGEGSCAAEKKFLKRK